MSAYALPFTLHQLVQHAAGKPLPFRELFVTGALTAIVHHGRAAWTAVVFVRSLDRLAKLYADQVVRYQGVIERIGNSDHAEHIDLDDALHQDLLRGESGKRDLIQALRSIWVEGAGREPRAVAAVIAAAHAAAEATADLRAAIQAHDANVDALRRARSGVAPRLVTTADELEADLGSAWRG